MKKRCPVYRACLRAPCVVYPGYYAGYYPAYYYGGSRYYRGHHYHRGYWHH